MKTIRKILVPIDFSQHSAQALLYAADLARRYEAKLELVHVFNISIYSMPDGIPMFAPGQFEQVTADMERLLENAKHDALAAGAQNVETCMLQGNPGMEILRLAREANFDLIVLGTHGRTGIKHLLIGSVAERVVRHSPCPVFTVKAIAQTESATVTVQSQA
jgi:nucleotide-binding universal stress UspA family protein